MNGPRPGGESDPRPVSALPFGGSRAAWVWVAGIAAVAMMGGMTFVVFAFLLLRGGDGGAEPVPAAGAPLPAAPGPDLPAPAGPPGVRALKDRIAALELEVLAWKTRVREMDAGQAAELADRLASGDPGGTDSARRVLEARGGTAGTVLARKILELRARIAALEADLALQRDKAEKTLEALLRAEREQKASRDGLRADRFYQRGLLEQQSGHHDLAEKDYGEALAADPAHAGALHGRGVARFALGDLEGALDDFTRATAIRPEFAPSHLCRGRVLMSLKKAGEAEEAFDRVLALDPGNAEAREAKEEAGRRRGG